MTGSYILRIMNALPGPAAACFRPGSRLAWAIRPLVNRLMPAGPTWITVRSGCGKGLRLLIYPAAEKFYWTGMHELPVQAAVTRILKPGMTFWDVGAHVGFLSLIASRLVGASGHVHAFEPMSCNRERLLVGIEANGATNVAVHGVALAAENGEAMLHGHASSLMWTLDPRRGQTGGASVACRTLDSFAELAGAPDLVKIDAEGAEAEVLRGGRHLLSATRPQLIVEFSDEPLLAEARDLLPFYSFEPLTPSHWLLRA